MSEIKTIKEVDDETWLEFKGIANKNKVKLGVLFKSMVGEYKKNSEKVWKKILTGEKILSDREAEELEKTVTSIRRDYGFRT